MVNNTLSERILEHIKDDILSGYYKPGDRLLYEKLASKFEVSLTPVKEALLRLEQEGLVTTIPRKGAYVSTLTPGDMREYIQIRFALERLAVEIICSRKIGEDEITLLDSINEEIAEAIREKNSYKCMAKDIEFHHAMVNLSGNKRLAELMNQLPLSNFYALMGNQNGMIEMGDTIISIHAAIIEALTLGESRKTISLLKKNILNPQLDLVNKTKVEMN